MNKDDPVGVALLEVGWRDEEPDEQTRSEQERGGYREPRNQLPSERVKHCRRCVFVKVHVVSHRVHLGKILFIL